MIEILVLCIMILVLVVCWCIWKIEKLSSDFESLENYVWKISGFGNQLREHVLFQDDPPVSLPDRPMDKFIGNPDIIV